MLQIKQQPALTVQEVSTLVQQANQCVKLASPGFSRVRRLQNAQFATQVDIQARDSRNVLGVLRGSIPLSLVPTHHKIVLAALLASLAQLDQPRALIVVLGTILMELWLVLLVLQEPQQRVLAALA